MQKNAKADLNKWLNQHRSTLDVNESILAKWFAKYDMRLRIALDNGEKYLSPMLVDSFKDMKIHVIFADQMLGPGANRFLTFSYREPIINVETGSPIPPAIIISEAERNQ